MKVLIVEPGKYPREADIEHMPCWRIIPDRQIICCI